MRIAIASRIFEPEPSAASLRLGALATALADAGHEVTVLTVSPPKRMRSSAHGAGRGFAVRRLPVLRDRDGYVRGYLQYLSFDIPLFFRILLGRRRDALVVEPPPTTAWFARLACRLRRIPYCYYAADIWSDAASQTGAPSWIVSAVRRVEVAAIRGARLVFSVSDGVTRRLAELGSGGRVVTVGNGIDTSAFAASSAENEGNKGEGSAPTFVYAGTASEWHGAGVFVDAMAEVLRREPRARLRFIGGGSEVSALRARAAELGVGSAVQFEPTLQPEELGPILHRSTAALASVRGGAGYDFAFPTKLYSAASCGAPLIFAGVGPAVEFVRSEVDGAAIGEACAMASAEVARAMIGALGAPATAERRARVADWARERVDLRPVAERIRAALEAEFTPAR